MVRNVGGTFREQRAEGEAEAKTQGGVGVEQQWGKSEGLESFVKNFGRDSMGAAVFEEEQLGLS